VPYYEFIEKIVYEGLYIVAIQKFKFQKMCIKVHSGSKINKTSFGLCFFGKSAISTKLINL
jgi:hypothetical protein